ncbi:hypothetical protein HDU98_003321 [Podochytrium sp. JEL0797]|nr:hypothetical protein HDU98_003321 [Podochytrium sp. JEL0797]
MIVPATLASTLPPDFSLTCASLVASGYHFDISALTATDRIVTEAHSTPPTTTTTTTGVALCRALTASEGVLSKCAADALVCQVTAIDGTPAWVRPYAALTANAKVAPAAVSVHARGMGFDLLLQGTAWGEFAPLATNLSLVCDKNAPATSNPMRLNTSTDAVLHLSWSSPAACGTPNGSIGRGGGGMSGTGLFLMFVMLGLFFYVSIGSAFNILVNRITRFPDFLPNFNFWESQFRSRRRTDNASYVRL